MNLTWIVIVPLSAIIICNNKTIIKIKITRIIKVRLDKFDRNMAEKLIEWKIWRRHHNFPVLRITFNIQRREFQLHILCKSKRKGRKEKRPNRSKYIKSALMNNDHQILIYCLRRL